MKPRIIDITYPLGDGSTVWPGDTPVSITPTREVGNGSRATVSRVVLGSHAGTHVDAPSHFLADGGHVDAINLDILVGPCVVVETDAGAVTGEVLEAMGVPAGTTRLLIKTRNGERYSGGEPFFEDYVGVTLTGAEWLVASGVRLVGIDYLSIAAHSEIEAVHHTLLGAEMVLLEMLDLRAVAPGPYQLAALPLKLADTDGAPTRAVLAPLSEAHRLPVS